MLTILKAFVLGLIDNNPDLTAVVFTNFVEKYREPSLKLLRTILTGSSERPGLLQAVSMCRIVIDGLDECESSEQTFIIDNLIQLLSSSACKLLICSRDVPEIGRALQRKAKLLASISLSNESTSVNNTIHAFAKSKIEDFIDEKPSLRVGSNTVDEMTQIIVDMSDGWWPCPSLPSSS